MKRLIRVLFALLLLAAFGQGPRAREASAQEPPKATSPSPDPLEEFVPHEKVPADSAVAFPVDI